MLTHFKNTHALVEHSRISHALCVLSLYPFIVYVCFLNVKNSLIDISSANRLWAQSSGDCTVVVSVVS